MGQHSEAIGVTVTQATINQVLGVLHQSQDVMGQVLTEFQDMKQLEREENVQMKNLNFNLGSLTGVLQNIYTHMH